MDAQYYTRIAMAGWIFVAVVFASLVAGGGQTWNHLVVVALSKDFNSAIPLAIVGAVIGIGAPPAAGFLMEKLTSVVVWQAKWTMSHYGCIEELMQAAPSVIRKQPRFQRTPPRAVFHLFLSSYATNNFRLWTETRQTHMYAALNGVVASWRFVRVMSYPVFNLGVESHNDLCGGLTTLLSWGIRVRSRRRSHIQNGCLYPSGTVRRPHRLAAGRRR
jgi:hypothetical protein